jgi:hypothetical protein
MNFCMNTGNVFLDIVYYFFAPQLDKNNVIWQQDGPLPTITGMWYGTGTTHSGKVDRSWRPHSVATQITWCDTHGLSFWWFVKNSVYIPHMTVFLQELRDRIVNSVSLANVTFLNKLWYNYNMALMSAAQPVAAILKTYKRTWSVNRCYVRKCIAIFIFASSQQLCTCVPYFFTPCI